MDTNRDQRFTATPSRDLTVMNRRLQLKAYGRCIAAAAGLPEPHVAINNTMAGTLGRFYRRSIQINIVACDKSPGLHYPGALMDLSAEAVLAHEIGHLWNRAMGWNRFWPVWNSETKGEEPVTNYACGSTCEDIAESFMIFVRNPSLLSIVAPKRYQVLFSHVQLVERREMEEVLEGAPSWVFEEIGQRMQQASWPETIEITTDMDIEFLSFAHWGPQRGFAVYRSYDGGLYVLKQQKGVITRHEM